MRNRYKKRTNIQTLNNELVQNYTEESDRKARMRKGRSRRIKVFLVFAVVILTGSIVILFNRQEHLVVKEKQQVVIAKQLEEAQQTQEMLRLQIAKLEDEEYIEKLARKEYFMSEEGEIIFTIPENDKE